jgi:aspartate oxidase
MTQSNGYQPDRLDRIEATLERMAAQAEMDRRVFTERMDQMQQQAEADRQQAEADRQQAEADRQQLRENLATLNEITIDFMGVTREAFVRLDQTIDRLDQTIAELRAANQRQERINDFLLRERGLNGG